MSIAESIAALVRAAVREELAAALAVDAPRHVTQRDPRGRKRNPHAGVSGCILAYLATNVESRTRDIARAVGISPQNAPGELRKLMAEGLVIKVGRGVYRAARRAA